MKKNWLMGICIIVISFVMTSPTYAKTENHTIQDDIIYDILIDRYNNGNQNSGEDIDVKDPYAYHGGDLAGIEAKLSEIEDLGFTAISLSPLMQNAKKGYHGHWTTDFKKVEPHFGSMKDLQKLVKSAHEKDIKVILELAPNYVSNDSDIVKDKADWVLDKQPKKDTYWKEDVSQLDYTNQAVRDYMLEVGTYWLDESGIDGYIIDEADKLPKTFLETFSKRLKEKNPEFQMIASLKDQTHYETFKQMDAIDLVDNQAFTETADDIFAKVENPIKPLIKSTNGLLAMDDDTQMRFAQIAGEGGRNALTTWKLALTYMYTSEGVPMVYQGSELPMYAPGMPESQMLVQFNSGDPELKEYMQRIAALRSEFPVLRNGKTEEVGTSEAMTVYKRYNDEDTVFVAINNDSKSRAVKIADIPEGKRLKGLLGDNIVKRNDDGEYVMTLSRETSEVYLIEDDTGVNWFLVGFIIMVMVVFVVGIIVLSRKQKARDQA